MTTPGFGGMGLLDSFMFGGGFEILFFLIFALVLCLFIVMIVRGVSQWHRNNNSPRLTVEAHHMTTSTRYYVTFQVESGDRMEFSVSGREYGLLVEGDTGRLTFQGTRYLGFTQP